MKAAEARKLAEENAPVIAKQQADEEKKRLAEEKKKDTLKHVEWRKNFDLRCRQDITWAVKNGKTETYLSPTTDYIRNQHLDEFVKEFEFMDDINKVIKDLKKDGYTAVLSRRDFEVDGRIAYLNSGGECGSERVYWDSDIVLRIKW
jgi:hypothetical protein